MAPSVALPKFAQPESEKSEVKGIKAVLLGPPGSGKGTQVIIEVRLLLQCTKNFHLRPLY